MQVCEDLAVNFESLIVLRRLEIIIQPQRRWCLPRLLPVHLSPSPLPLPTLSPREKIPGCLLPFTSWTNGPDFSYRVPAEDLISFYSILVYELVRKVFMPLMLLFVALLRFLTLQLEAHCKNSNFHVTSLPNWLVAMSSPLVATRLGQYWLLAQAQVQDRWGVGYGPVSSQGLDWGRK